MSTLNRVTLDGIIFGLQKIGGISNYWARLVDYVSNANQLESSLIVPNNIKFRDFNTDWLERMPVQHEKLDIRVARYLPVKYSGQCDIFHTSYYRVPQNKVKKYVVTVYDFTYERYRSGLARLIHNKQKLASINMADEVLCISDSTKQDVLEFCPNVDANKVHVIPLAVDGKTFFQDELITTSSIDFVVLFVGQRNGYKRFDLAVEAISQSPRLTLGVVGPELTDKEKQVLQARLGKRWREFGPVSNDKLRRLYSSVFAFIFPSDYEGFGLPILEAMACGCPVVAASRSSFPEIGGGAACYAKYQTPESYSAVLNELDSISVRKDVIKRGLERASEYNWSQTFKKTMSIYLNL